MLFNQRIELPIKSKKHKFVDRRIYAFYFLKWILCNFNLGRTYNNYSLNEVGDDILMLYEGSLLLISAFLVMYILTLQKKVRKLQEERFVELETTRDGNMERQIITMSKEGKTRIQIIKFVREEASLDVVNARRYVNHILG